MSKSGRWTQRPRLSDGQKRIDRFRGAEERSDRAGENAARCRTATGAWSSRPTPGREARPPVHAAPANRIARKMWALLAHDRRTAATARVRRRSGRSDTKERRRAERLRKTRRRVMANRSDRDRPDPNPIAHEAQLGAAVFPGARASCPRAHSWTGHAPVDFTSLGSAAGSAGCAMARWSRRHEALAGWKPALPGSRASRSPWSRPELRA